MDRWELAVGEADALLSTLLEKSEGLSSVELLSMGGEILDSVAKIYKIAVEDLSALSEIWVLVKRETLQRKFNKKGA